MISWKLEVQDVACPAEDVLATNSFIQMGRTEGRAKLQSGGFFGNGKERNKVASL